MRAFEGKIAQLQEEIAAVDAGYDADKAGREQRRKAAQDVDKALQIQREVIITLSVVEWLHMTPSSGRRRGESRPGSRESCRGRYLEATLDQRVPEENRKKAKGAETRAVEAAAEKERLRKE